MSAVTTLAVTVAAAVGVVAFVRYADKRTKPLRDSIRNFQSGARSEQAGAVIDYEQDPESGVFKPRV